MLEGRDKKHQTAVRFGPAIGIVDESLWGPLDS